MSGTFRSVVRWSSAAHQFRNIRVFFGWLAGEGERENPNPMDRVEAPKVTKKAKAFFTEEELARLLKTQCRLA